MDNNFTRLIKAWLETPADERDYNVGALYLLKLSSNQIMYRNLIANPKGKAEFIEYQIRKYYNFRVQALTHEEVEDMQKQVDVIVAEHISLAAKVDEQPPAKGKRDDLILAIQSAGVSRGRNGFRKDKSGEKLAESEESLLEHRTDGSDAFDTLYIGAEKFPYHETFSVSGSGIL